MSEKTPTIAAAAPITNFALASRVAKDVELRAVLLRRAQLSSDYEPDAEQPAEVSQQHRSSFELDAEQARIFVSIGFTLALNSKATPSLEIMSLAADYRLVYTIPQGASYDEAALRYFADLNGTLNVWPYWRELVNSAASRVGLGGITLPVFRPKPETVASESEPLTASPEAK